MSKCRTCDKDTKNGKGNGRFCSLICRFNSKIKKTDYCWEWLGGKISKRYGGMQFGKKNKLAHRVSWEISFGEIPNGYEVCHRCDNGFCVNPEHLFLGTHQENMNDMANKKRTGHRPPDKIPYTEHSKIIEMLKRGMKRYEIAKIYNCSSTQISTIGNKHGIFFNPYKKIPKEDYELIGFLIGRGISGVAIAKFYNTTRHNIYRVLRILENPVPK